jgi:flavin reductase
MAFDSADQRRIMGCFATGVTVITTTDGESATGFTANSMTSLSLDPPLVLFALKKTAGSHAAFVSSKKFAVNILTVEQEAVSNRFASPGPKEFSDLNTTTAETGSPILSDSLAWVDCKLVDVIPGGDHDIFIGEVLAGDVNGGEPLLYFGGYRQLAAKPQEAS